MYSLNNRRIILIKNTINMLSSASMNPLQASCILYLITGGGGTCFICAKQFTCITDTEINYNIFIINTTNNNLSSVKLLDILPSGATNPTIMLEGTTHITPISTIDNSLEFMVNTTISAHSYSRVVVTIDNNSNIDVGSNTVQILEVS